MTIFIIVVGILGIILALGNLYGGALHIVAQWRSGRSTAGVMPATVWQMNTLPLVSAALLLVLKHWLFTIPILLLLLILGLRFLGTGFLLPIYEMLSKLLVAIAPSVILTLSFVHQNDNVHLLFSTPWIWFWLFPALAIAFWFGLSIVQRINKWLIGLVASMIHP